MGITVYLDEADHVGIADQPFYYGGMLNIFKMRSNLVRMPLSGGNSLADGEAAFTRVLAALRARGGGTISIYYHPNEWVQTEFWDAVNFRGGANPPPSEWKRPGIRPAAETDQAFADFEQFVRFMKSQDGVHFATASELASLYADRALNRSFGKDDLLHLARSMQKEITFEKFEAYVLSAADAFSLLTDAASALVVRKEVPATIPLRPLDGPTRAFNPSIGGQRSSTFQWSAFADAIRDTQAYCQGYRRVPDEIWIGAENISPADYLATLGAVLEHAIASGETPNQVERRTGQYTADQYVAEDSPSLWDWIIFPEGFHAPRLMELARLQAWTLKPAVLSH
jgi:hypothetical protein